MITVASDIGTWLREAVLALTATPPLPADKRQRLEAVVIDLLEPVPDAETRRHLLPEPGADRLRAVAAILRADPADPRMPAELGRPSAPANALSAACSARKPA